MKKIVATGKFKKDVKRYSNRPDKLHKLYKVVKVLSAGNNLPAESKLHVLSGNHKDFMECHIENDLLLIWLDELEDIIKLVRFGTHSELFK